MGELISAYVDNELSDEDVAFVKAHLETCEACQALAEEIQSLSVLTRNAFSDFSASEWLEQRVMATISSVRKAKQNLPFVLIAICGVLVTTILAMGSALAPVVSFCWAVLHLVFRIAHGIELPLLRFILGQGWLVAGIVIVGITLIGLSVVGIRSMMRHPVDVRVGSS
jgi:anti-sigma factor RsiW